LPSPLVGPTGHLKGVPCGWQVHQESAETLGASIPHRQKRLFMRRVGGEGHSGRGIAEQLQGGRMLDSRRFHHLETPEQNLPQTIVAGKGPPCMTIWCNTLNVCPFSHPSTMSVLSLMSRSVLIRTKSAKGHENALASTEFHVFVTRIEPRFKKPHWNLSTTMLSCP